MPDSPGDRSLVNLWRAGDEKAAQQLFERYLQRLLSLARQRISTRLAGRVDPEDVVQSVFRTFFQRAKEGQFDLQDPDDLCKLLVRITLNKTLRQVEFHKAAKRDPGAEQRQESDESQDRLLQVLDSEPTPDATNAFLDQLEHFLGKLSPVERQVVELRMNGYDNEEIAAKLGTYDRKVRRVMDRIKGLAAEEWLSSHG